MSDTNKKCRFFRLFFSSNLCNHKTHEFTFRRMKKQTLTALSAFMITAFAGIDFVALAKQYPLSISAKESGSIAEIRISGVIHQWQNSASEFKRTIDDLIAKGIKDVKLYINTPGGSVFEANEIANEIKRFKGTISGKGGALVASAGSYLAIICTTFDMAENGQYMYHKPMGNITGNEDEVSSGLKLLQNLTNQYRKAYADKTGMSEDKIESNWVKGDVWLSAQEAKDQGFITGISKEEESITEEQQALFVACGAKNIPQLNIIKDEKMKNRNQIIAKLKLSADATDEQIEEAVAKAMNVADQFTAAAKQNEQNMKQAAEQMVQSFIDSKQTTADLKDTWVAMAQKDFEGTKKILSAQPKATQLSAELNPEAQANGNAGREKWTLQDYMDKDPKALDEMFSKEPEKFMQLNDAYYGS